MSNNITTQERKLLSLVAKGDEKAFAVLIENIMPYLQATVIGLVHSNQQTDEILQETFIRIWMAREKLPELENPKAWFKKVTQNETFTWLSKNAYRAKIFQRLSEPIAIIHPTGPDNISYRETLGIVNKAIDQLPPQRKLIFQLSRVHGLRPKDIARQLNISTGYVKNTLGVAFQFIRKRLIDADK